jgi:hypothetical protein
MTRIIRTAFIEPLKLIRGRSSVVDHCRGDSACKALLGIIERGAPTGRRVMHVEIDVLGLGNSEWTRFHLPNQPETAWDHEGMVRSSDG